MNGGMHFMSENNLTLDQIGLKYNTDKCSSFHNYLSLYDKEMCGIRNSSNKILEIGVLFGDSLKVFSEYFNESEIYAIDIENKSQFSTDRVKIFQADQSDRQFLESNFQDEFFDIILDDGSHKMDHQQISFGSLFKKLKKGGIYIIEDLHTSLPEYIETVAIGKHFFGLNDDNSKNI